MLAYGTKHRGLRTFEDKNLVRARKIINLHQFFTMEQTHVIPTVAVHPNPSRP